MYMSRTGSLFLGGLNVLSGLTISIDSLKGLSEKYSMSRNFRQNFLISALSSTKFMLGTGVNFNTYFLKTCFACSFMMVEERFMSFGLMVSVILDRPEVGLSTKKNHLQFLESAAASCPLDQL